MSNPTKGWGTTAPGAVKKKSWKAHPHRVPERVGEDGGQEQRVGQREGDAQRLPADHPPQQRRAVDGPGGGGAHDWPASDVTFVAAPLSAASTGCLPKMTDDE
ncbi:hypothetical protein GCM10025868_44800 [Angustibacter aerolatus]|uniref:Uncharacterized protein n=1 Tax=Angustibacter aerolatus TaxID=1162965 RepID=A0ABQ6JRA8_9ACTN|nr:hypothetical protein GCM10025868_44800 [Angustibacter aerolatus]